MPLAGPTDTMFCMGTGLAFHIEAEHAAGHVRLQTEPVSQRLILVGTSAMEVNGLQQAMGRWMRRRCPVEMQEWYPTCSLVLAHLGMLPARGCGSGTYGARRSRGCTCRSGLASGPRAACGPVRPGYVEREQAHDALQGQGLRSARHTQAAALTSPQAAADPHVPRSPRQRLGDGARPVRALWYWGEGTVLPKLPFPWRSPQPTYFLCSRVQGGTANRGSL